MYIKIDTNNVKLLIEDEMSHQSRHSVCNC